jgi:uncharacterized membrane protein
MENSQIILLFKILVGLIIFVIIVLQYIEGRIRDRNNKELEENMSKHITLTGGLENDRLNERPKKRA